MRRFFSDRAWVDFVVLAATGLAAWQIARHFAVPQRLDLYFHLHDNFSLGSVLMLISICGLAGVIFAGRRLAESHQEIERRRAAERHVDWTTSHDMLTKLPNRRYLEAAKAEMVAWSPDTDRYAAFSIDLDGFRKVNDLVGGEGGDTLLVGVTRRLSRMFPHDTIYRLGADEFLIVVPRTDKTDLAALGNRIVRRLRKPFDIAGKTVEIGASVGFARFPEDGGDAAEMIRRSDIAMHVAKKTHHESVCAFVVSMDQELMRWIGMEAELRRAVRDDRIEPFFQPLIDLRTGRICGFEALARWRADDGHWVPPSDFIPLAEDVGLISELCDNLLRRACMDAQSWPPGVRLAFNISPVQLADRQLGLRIMDILLETGFNPKRLEIEITESALVCDIFQAEETLGRLHAAGVCLALDDFGTGYSSLSQLSRFSFDKIKIDRSFVASFAEDAKQEKIVRAIVGLSQGLGIVTTAEGIENESELDDLRKMGCDYGQGYLFGRAIPSDDARRLLAAQQTPAVRLSR